MLTAKPVGSASRRESCPQQGTLNALSCHLSKITSLKSLSF
jgi:hypothetical protein